MKNELMFLQITDLAKQKTPFFSGIWEKGHKEHGEKWAYETVDNFVRLYGFKKNKQWTAALRGYAEFVIDSMKDQNYFEKHRRYRSKTAAELKRTYCRDKVYMLKNYLPGVHLSHYLWPHHFRLLTFFRNEVLPRLKNPSLFFEIGVGAGIYSREALLAFPQIQGKGFDISSHSLSFTKMLLKKYALEDRYQTQLGDILKREPPEVKADFVVCHEVLEHVDKPQQLCDVLYALVKERGFAYITAALNSAHWDHIYLFRKPQEVQAMLIQSGWKIIQQRTEYAYANKPKLINPGVSAFMCQR